MANLDSPTSLVGSTSRLSRLFVSVGESKREAPQRAVEDKGTGFHVCFTQLIRYLSVENNGRICRSFRDVRGCEPELITRGVGKNQAFGVWPGERIGFIFISSSFALLGRSQ